MALSAAKLRSNRLGQGPILSITSCKAKASTQFYEGGLVVADGTTGLLEPATAATSKYVVGVAAETKLTGSADFVKVRRGAFKFNVKTGDEVTVALLMRDCYIEDDDTVRATSTGSSRAGKVVEVDASGYVWVETI